MKEEQFEEFLSGSINGFADSYINYAEYSDKPHEFSAGHERRMKRLIKKQKTRAPAAKIGFRRAFAVTAVIIIMAFAAVMSVSALREAFFSFITRPFSDHTDIEAVSSGSAPDIIEKNYEIGYIPDGFTLTEKYDVRELCNTRIYSNGTDSFEFSQWVRSAYSPSVNTEGYELVPVTVNGREGFMLDMKDTGRCIISWDGGDYIFQVAGSPDSDTLMDIAASVRISQ